jgi:K(+)-stimulated pyrophosphate-energized sodium pump
MNLVSLLIAPAVVALASGENANTGIRVAIAIVAVLIVAGAVYISKRRPVAIGEETPETVNAA